MAFVASGQAQHLGNGCISLLVDETALRTAFWFWDDVQTLLGRDVTLDSLQRVKYAQPVTRRHLNPGVRIVIPNTTATMVKTTARFRIDMPDIALRVRRMIEACIAGDAEGINIDLDVKSCSLCGQAGRSCCCCLLSWHDSCQEVVGAEIKDTFDARAHLQALMPQSTIRLCKWCSLHLAETCRHLPHLSASNVYGAQWRAHVTIVHFHSCIVHADVATKTHVYFLVPLS